MANMSKERQLKRREAILSTAEARANDTEAKLAANVAVQESIVEEQKARRRKLGIDISRKEQRLKKARRALDARAARLKVKDSNHATHGRKLQELKGEVVRQMAEVDRRGIEAQEDLNRRQSELSTWEEEASKQRTELERRAKDLDTRQAQMTLESQELIRCREELEKRLQEVQDENIEQTRRTLGVTCTLEDELMTTARSSLEKLAPRSGEVLTRQQSRCILQLFFELLLTSRRSEIDAEILVSQARETMAANHSDAFMLNYDCFVPVCSGFYALSIALSRRE